MSEMVERVARAMCEKAGTDWSDTSGNEYAPPLISRPFWTQQARAAIEAMREPTDEMVIAALGPWTAEHGEVLAANYTDMIDEALSGECKRNRLGMIDAALK